MLCIAFYCQALVLFFNVYFLTSRAVISNFLIGSDFDSNGVYSRHDLCVCLGVNAGMFLNTKYMEVFFCKI